VTTLNGYIKGLGSGADRIVRKTGKEVKLSVFDNIDDVIVFNQEGETKQEGTPTPSNPVEIEGIGFLYHGSYAVAIDYDDGDEHYGRILATGLSYPLYEGDILDFANSKVIRANGYKVFDGSENWSLYPAHNGYYLRISDMMSGYQLNSKSNRFIKSPVLSDVENSFQLGFNNSVLYMIQVNISGVTDIASWKTWLASNNTAIVYPLASPTEEYITIEGGDISDIGTARVLADGTLRIKYDNAEMAIRKYSAKPDWQKIGYSDTPKIILDAFDYSKRIYDSWTPSASYASQYRGDKALKFFPEVDITGATNYSAMFQESGILSTPPLTIGDGSNTVINSQLMFQTSPIEKIELTTSEATQKVQIANIFNGCTMLKNAKLTLSASGSMQYAFADCNRLERIEDGLETSDVTSFSEAFRACSSLLYLYELDLSSCTTCYRAFQNCTSLESAPYLNNIRTGGNFAQMFWNCSSLKVLPPYNLGSPSNLTNMFQGTGSNLEETSRINILVMLATCTYSGTKTLAHLGFTASMYSAASWQALPHYNDFVSAGWSIGYS
jgi:hypothetical protein